MSAFSLLWSKMLDSSLWVKGTKEDRLVWMTILMMKNEDGRLFSSEVGLAYRARVTEDECRQALTKFLSPDPDDTSGVEEGRRLRRIPGGWEVVNNDLYRYSTAERREFWRVTKAAQRAKQKAIEDGKRGISKTAAELSAMSPEEREAYNKARLKAKRDVLKKMAKQGEIDGRTEAVVESLKREHSQIANDNAAAEQHCSEADTNSGL